jgi:hypothetical protein
MINKFIRFFHNSVAIWIPNKIKRTPPQINMNFSDNFPFKYDPQITAPNEQTPCPF